MNPVIKHLFLSPGHRYFGRHGMEPKDHPMEAVDTMECQAGRGIPGDRFFDYKPDYKGQITFFAWEDLIQMWEDLKLPEEARDPSATRRNVVTLGVALQDLVGQEFEIQGIRFLGMEECRPCYWMNGSVHERAEQWMQGRGGLRAKILRDGFLRSTQATESLTAALMVGGQSRRMGTDKAQLVMEGQPLWKRQLHLLQGVCKDQVMVSGRERPSWMPDAIPFCQDQYEARCAMAGIVSALAQYPCQHIQALAVDMPRMTPACLEALICLMTPTAGVVAMVGDFPEPLAAIYPPGALESGDRRMRDGKHTLRDWIVELESLGLMRRWNIPPALKPCFENVNHPGDWNAFAP